MRTPMLATLALLAGCTTTSPLYCDEQTPCTDPERPFCDLTGEHPGSDGHAKTCVPDPGAAADAGPPAPTCSANETRCVGDLLVTCDADGEVANESECALGCFADEARCYELEPSNGLGPYLEMAAGAPPLALSDGAEINTSTGHIRNGDGSVVSLPSELVEAVPGGVPLRVFMAAEASLGDLRIIGEPAFALVVAEQTVVSGEISLEGTPDLPPPGMAPRELCELARAYECSGGGGGGFGGPGGQGGAKPGQPSGPAGQPVGTESVSPLRGGCAGGGTTSSAEPEGGEYTVVMGLGGDGGGAMQLVSGASFRIEAGGLSAAGRGGPVYTAILRCGGGGGGSGGAILLEAPTIELGPTTFLAANGGGGGCIDAAGTGGRNDSEAAPGGTCDDAADGGRGATRTYSAHDGTLDAEGSRGGGGGGGGIGRIRINAGRAANLDGVLISPAPSLGFPAAR